MASGSHRITVKAWASTTSYSTSVNITGGGGGGTSCTASTIGVTICQPANNDSVGSPVQIVAAAKGNVTVQTMKIYLDGSSVYSVQASQIDTSLVMSSGSHRITVKAWD